MLLVTENFKRAILFHSIRWTKNNRFEKRLKFEIEIGNANGGDNVLFDKLLPFFKLTLVAKLYSKRFTNFKKLSVAEVGRRATRVLPIVGLDVGAIGCLSLSALVQAEGTLLNIRINFQSLNK